MSTEWTLERLQADLDACPSIAFHQMRAETIKQEQTEVVLTMALRPELERAPGSGMFHGGPVAALIDTAGDYAVALAVGGGVPTMNLRVDYLRPCTGSLLRARAKARRVGKSVAVVDIDIIDDQARLCAIGRGSYSTNVG
ncbi:MAG: PaaI family thioesterase [Pseudomonadota bacterium]